MKRRKFLLTTVAALPWVAFDTVPAAAPSKRSPCYPVKAQAARLNQQIMFGHHVNYPF